MTRHTSPELGAIAGAFLAVATAFIAIRAFQRGRIVVGPNWRKHYVRRKDQPARFWIAFGGNAAVFLLGVFLALSWLIDCYAQKEK